jgi:hypothetical protein
MRFYARDWLVQWHPRGRAPLSEIVTITKLPRLALILLALALAGQLQAQIDLPAPDVPVAGSEDQQQTETAPSPEVPPEAPVQIRPDEGSPVAGTGIATPEFDSGRHFQLSGSLNGGYDDNVNLTPTGSPSWYVNPTVSVGYRFGSARLAMDLLTGGGINYYVDHPGGRYYDPIVYLQFSLAYKATPRLTLNFSTASAYESQPEYGTQFNTNRRLGDYFRSQNQFSAHYSLSHRLSSVTGYSLNALEYASTAGSLHDRLENAFSEQLRYLWLPTTTATGEYRFGINDFQNTGQESTTHSLIGGLEQSFSPDFKASLHSGIQFRSGSRGGQISPYLETSLEYEPGSQGTAASRQLGARTYIIWTNRYSIEESDVGTGRETFRTNLKLNYAMSARLSASLALIYSHGDNGTGNQGSRSLGGSRTQNIFDITPSIRYAISRRCSVNVGYRYTQVDQGSRATTLELLQAINSYTRNRYFAGITISY